MKTKYVISAVISISALFLSCTKEQIGNKGAEVKNYPMFRGAMEAVTPADEAKAELNTSDLSISWKAGDEIFVTDGSGKAIYQATADGSTTDFTYKSGDELATGPEVNYTAYYPASLVKEDGSLCLSLKQPYVAENISYIPMKAEATGSLNLNFRNLTGIVKISLKATAKNTFVTYHIGCTADRALSGPVTIQDGKAVTGNETMQGVVFEGVSETIDGVSAKNFYLAVPEGSYNNFIVNVSQKDRGNFIGANKAINIYRSKVTSIDLSSIKLYNVQSSALNSADWATTLAAEGASNCYMVSKRGSKIPYFYISAGKGATSISGGVAAEVLWETDGTETEVQRGDILKAVSYEGENKRIYLMFPKSLKAGSALIALRNEGGEILWSWHIWVTPGTEPGTVAYTKKDGTALCTMMDRNVGAIGSTQSDGIGAYGFYYQSGRKDPFVHSSIKVTGIQRSSAAGPVDYALSVKNPTTFYTIKDAFWDGDGTWFGSLYDPCPQGYIMPNISSTGNPWDSSDYFKQAEVTASWVDGEGCNLQVNNLGDKTWIPATGYLTYSGVVTKAGEAFYFWGRSSKKYGYFTKSAGGMNKNFPARNEGYSVRCVKQ